MSRFRAGRAAQRRVRWWIYGAFALLAAMACFLARYGDRDERVRAADAEIIHMAGLQAIFTQRMGRLAALIVAAPRIDAQGALAPADTLVKAG